MILGMSLQTFTTVHVIISLVAIASGLVVLFGMLGSHKLGYWTAFFLFTMILTSVTGFMFPIQGFTPALAVGVLSLVILAFASAFLGVRHEPVAGVLFMVALGLLGSALFTFGREVRIGLSELDHYG